MHLAETRKFAALLAIFLSPLALANWEKVENLPVAFAEPIAAKLPNGNVAVAGQDSDGRWKTLVWNVDQKRWSKPLEFPAEQVPGGKPSVTALVSGELFFFSSRATVFNPQNGTWRSAAAPKSARLRATATRLRDGRVLVAGGEDPSKHTAFATAEVYDPVRDTWADAGTMNQARVGHTAALLDSGKVLVAGTDYGTGISQDGSSSTELWDAVTSIWKRSGALPVRGAALSTVLSLTALRTGQVLASGFEEGATFLWSPTDERWRDAGRLVLEHDMPFTTTLLNDGSVLLAGGDENQASHLSTQRCQDLSESVTKGAAGFTFAIGLLVAWRLGRRRVLWFALGGLTGGAVLYVYALLNALGGALRG